MAPPFSSSRRRRSRYSFPTIALRSLSSTISNNQNRNNNGSLAGLIPSKRRITIGCDNDISIINDDIIVLSPSSLTAGTMTPSSSSSFFFSSSPDVGASGTKGGGREQVAVFSIHHANDIFQRELRRSFEEYRSKADGVDGNEEDGDKTGDELEELAERDRMATQHVVLEPSEARETPKDDDDEDDTDIEEQSRACLTSTATTNTTTTTSCSPPSPIPSPPRIRSVRFSDTAELRHFPLILGDNPSTSICGNISGPPLSLDWNWMYQEMKCIKEDKFLQPTPRRRSAKERDEIVRRHGGYTTADIQVAIQKIRKIQKQRSQSRRRQQQQQQQENRFLVYYYTMLETLERTVQNVKSFCGSKKRKEKEYLRQCGC